MKETPRVVINRRERVETPVAPREFSFVEDQVRAAGLSAAVREYRQQAWQVFTATPLPTPQEEAWRRTDLKALRPDVLRLPDREAYLDLPGAPEYLLEPLTGSEHGGQVILLPGGANVTLAQELSEKGVVFTDLLTAEREHPEILDRVIGKIVRPSDGKFAALATKTRQNIGGRARK